jgi:hypothetical protein
MSGNRILRSVKSALARSAGLASIVPLVYALMSGPCLADGPVIDHLSNVDKDGKPTVGDVAVRLDDKLAVVLKIDPATAVDARKAVLVLDGREIGGLKDTLYRSNDKALIFHLVRNDDNAESWQPLLASPGLTPRLVSVGLWLEKPSAPASKPPAPAPTPIGLADGSQPTLSLIQLPRKRLWAGAVAVVVVLVMVFSGAAKTNILKDALLPQLAPKNQTFSLGRTQMAFWFTLIFAAYVFLFVLIWDYNTLTSQALVLMGLSGATAIFAVAIDASKETPIGTANERLCAIGLHTYGDVLQLDREIEQRQAALKQTDPNNVDAVLKLQTEITDRQNKKRSWREITQPFITEGWYRDVTTDINGPALHRLQIFVWTVTLGVLFLLDVYHTLAMPRFSELQLSLVGVSCAGYLGFKYPERQH